MFEKPAGGWTNMSHETSRLSAADGGANDLFGFAVAIDGNTIAVGALRHQVGLSRQGATYVYVKSTFGFSTSETQTAELTASDGVTNDRFGAQVAVSANNVLVGSFLHQVGNNPSQGAAYVFSRPGPVWRNTTETQELTAADGVANDAFADAIAFSGDTPVVSAPLKNVGANEGQGAIYVFGPAPASAAPPPGGDAASSTAGATTPAGASSGPASTAPSLTGVRESASVWRAGGKLAQIAATRRRPVGTTFSFALDQPATVTLRFSRQGHGHRRARPVGAITLAGHAGVNRVHFEGRISRSKRLKPGRYSVAITATNTTNQATTARPLRFRIVK